MSRLNLNVSETRQLAAAETALLERLLALKQSEHHEYIRDYLNGLTLRLLLVRNQATTNFPQDHPAVVLFNKKLANTELSDDDNALIRKWFRFPTTNANDPITGVKITELSAGAISYANKYLDYLTQPELKNKIDTAIDTNDALLKQNKPGFLKASKDSSKTAFVAAYNYHNIAKLEEALAHYANTGTHNAARMNQVAHLRALITAYKTVNPATRSDDEKAFMSAFAEIKQQHDKDTNFINRWQGDRLGKLLENFFPKASLATTINKNAKFSAEASAAVAVELNKKQLFPKGVANKYGKIAVAHIEILGDLTQLQAMLAGNITTKINSQLTNYTGQPNMTAETAQTATKNIYTAEINLLNTLVAIGKITPSQLKTAKDSLHTAANDTVLAHFTNALKTATVKDSILTIWTKAKAFFDSFNKPNQTAQQQKNLLNAALSQINAISVATLQSITQANAVIDQSEKFIKFYQTIFDSVNDNLKALVQNSYVTAFTAALEDADQKNLAAIYEFFLNRAQSIFSDVSSVKQNLVTALTRYVVANTATITNHTTRVALVGITENTHLFDTPPTSAPARAPSAEEIMQKNLAAETNYLQLAATFLANLAETKTSAAAQILQENLQTAFFAMSDTAQKTYAKQHNELQTPYWAHMELLNMKQESLLTIDLSNLYNQPAETRLTKAQHMAFSENTPTDTILAFREAVSFSAAENLNYTSDLAKHLTLQQSQETGVLNQLNGNLYAFVKTAYPETDMTMDQVRETLSSKYGLTHEHDQNAVINVFTQASGSTGTLGLFFDMGVILQREMSLLTDGVVLGSKQDGTIKAQKVGNDIVFTYTASLQTTDNRINQKTDADATAMISARFVPGNGERTPVICDMRSVLTVSNAELARIIKATVTDKAGVIYNKAAKELSFEVCSATMLEQPTVDVAPRVEPRFDPPQVAETTQQDTVTPPPSVPGSPGHASRASSISHSPVPATASAPVGKPAIFQPVAAEGAQEKQATGTTTPTPGQQRSGS